MDEIAIEEEPREIATPAWFKAAAILALLWEALGCAMYLIEVTADPARLPLDQRVFAEASPIWMTAAYAIAVWSGLIGAILLVRRKDSAVAFLILSLATVIVQFSGLLLVPGLRRLTNSAVLTFPLVIVLVGYGVLHLALLARRRGWLG